ncbi:MAG TPA: deaminase [Candidatus Moranbacteria bacterium]|nr:deaminase [Candidatus Moranbacteria bacterium]
MKKIIIAYVPVLHEGYRRFFEKYKKSVLYILGQDLILKSDYLYKEIRALDSIQMKKAIESLKIFKEVNILDRELLEKIKKEETEIIMPNEDITRELSKKYFHRKKIIFDDIFLRWDKHNTIREFPINPDIKISRKEFDKEMMLKANKKSKESSDWWRRIGSVIVKNKRIIISTCNKHVPSEHIPFINGDPRIPFHKGINLEFSTAIHGEAAAIAEAAKKGISLEGASIYVTTFPCPPCAKLIAYSGIKKLYYNIGYGVLDGESILKQKGVEIILVDMKLPKEKGLGVVEYKK